MCGAATCDLNHIMISCTHFGERPSLDDIAEMKDGYVRWLTAVADSTSRGVMLFGEKAHQSLRTSHHSYITLFSALLEFCLACREQSDEGTNDNDGLSVCAKGRVK